MQTKISGWNLSWTISYTEVFEVLLRLYMKKSIQFLVYIMIAYLENHLLFIINKLSNILKL
jgi:hypothetical protein